MTSEDGNQKGLTEELCRRRKALVESLKKGNTGKALVYLEGANVQCRDDTDVELPFRQESNFLYLTGVEDLHGCAMIIDLTSSTNNNAAPEYTLYVPRVSADDAVWIGSPPSLDLLKSRYIHPTENGKVDYLENAKASWEGASLIYTLAPTKSPLFDTSNKTIDNSSLKDVICSLRMIKSKWEIEVMRHVNKCSSESHAALMSQRFKAHNEFEYAARWFSECLSRGLHQQAYMPIVAHGKNSAILHYNHNNAPITDQQSFMLVDAGAEYHGYASDITRTWPISGKFSEKQRILYQIVLDCQKLVIESIKPGVEWESLHRLATEKICEGLLNLAGVIKANTGKTVKELCWELYIPQLFFPHGLGHLIGMDVHDVGGYPEGVQRIQEPAIRYLRMRRVLEAGMVVTVEPGCYFIDQILDGVSETQKQLLDWDVLKEYRKLGGVRIEDCVVVTSTGYDNLTCAPKEISEIQSLMA